MTTIIDLDEARQNRKPSSGPNDKRLGDDIRINTSVAELRDLGVSEDVILALLLARDNRDRSAHATRQKAYRDRKKRDAPRRHVTSPTVTHEQNQRVKGQVSRSVPPANDLPTAATTILTKNLPKEAEEAVVARARASRSGQFSLPGFFEPTLPDDWRPPDKELVNARKAFQSLYVEAMIADYRAHQQSQGTPVSKAIFLWRRWVIRELKIQGKITVDAAPERPAW